MVFKDLIEELKKIKKTEDLTFEVAEELVTAGITSLMSIEMQEDEDLVILEAFDESRLLVMKMFDVILLDITMNKYKENELHDLSDLSPMHDEEFKADIEKAIQEYNQRVKKK